MKGSLRSRGVRAAVAAGAGAIVFAVAASVGAAVSPTGTHSASHKYQYDKKVTICHRTGSKRHPFVTIRVSRSAVRKHLAHGDKLGPCSRATFTVCHKSWRSKRTIKVTGVQALRHHLRHGDRLGSCGKHGRDKKRG
jgi:hypothetical protein